MPLAVKGQMGTSWAEVSASCNWFRQELGCMPTLAWAQITSWNPHTGASITCPLASSPYNFNYLAKKYNLQLLNQKTAPCYQMISPPILPFSSSSLFKPQSFLIKHTVTFSQINLYPNTLPESLSSAREIKTISAVIATNSLLTSSWRPITKAEQAKVEDSFKDIYH